VARLGFADYYPDPDPSEHRVNTSLCGLFRDDIAPL